MKTFKDLVFEPHFREAALPERFYECKSARMEFNNGYGVSVLFGDLFYSNGIDTYEVGILYKGILTYETGITKDVISSINADEITEVMKRVQKLPIIN